MNSLPPELQTIVYKYLTPESLLNMSLITKSTRILLGKNFEINIRHAARHYMTKQIFQRILINNDTNLLYIISPYRRVVYCNYNDDIKELIISWIPYLPFKTMRILIEHYLTCAERYFARIMKYQGIMLLIDPSPKYYIIINKDFCRAFIKSLLELIRTLQIDKIKYILDHDYFNHVCDFLIFTSDGSLIREETNISIDQECHDIFNTCDRIVDGKIRTYMFNLLSRRYKDPRQISITVNNGRIDRRNKKKEWRAQKNNLKISGKCCNKFRGR